MPEPTPPSATAEQSAPISSPLNDAAAAITNQPLPPAEEPGFLKMFKDIPPIDDSDKGDDKGDDKEKPGDTKDTTTPDKTPRKKGEKKVYEHVNLDEIPDDAPDGSTEKQKIHWGHLKQTAAAAKSKAAEAEAAKASYEAKIAEMETKIAEAEEKAKFVDEAERELSIHKIESSREYKQVVDRPLEAIEVQIVEIAKEYEIEPSDIADAIKEPDRRKRAKLLDEITTGMNQADRDDVHQMARDTREIFDKRDKLRERALEAKGQLDKITAQKEASDKAQFRKTYSEHVGSIMKKLAERIPFEPTKDGETAEAFFSGIKDQSLAAEFDVADPASQATAVAAIFVLPRMIEQTKVLKANLKAAEKRIAEFLSARPGGGSDTLDRKNDTETLPPGWRPGMISH